MPARTIEQLNDIEDIQQLKARYCRLIDQKKWSELESELLPDAVIEINGAPGGAEDVQRFTSARQFIDGLKRLMGPVVSVHQVHAPEVELLGDEAARGTWTICDRLVFKDGPLKVLQGWGIYEERYQKASGKWRIASLRLDRLLIEPVGDAGAADPKRVAERLLKCIADHNTADMTALFAEDLEWFVPGSSGLPWTGRRTRGSQVAEFFSVMWPRYVESSAEIDEIVSDQENVFVTGKFSHVIRDGGQSFTTPVVLHLKVREGKIRHLQLYEDTLLISQAFGLADGHAAVGPADLPRSLTETSTE